MESHPYLAKVDPRLVRVFGAVIGVFGLVLVAALVRGLVVAVKVVNAGAVLPTATMAAAVVIPILAAASLQVGYRFFFNRPNANGTLLSSFSWMVVGATLLSLTIAVAVFTTPTAGDHLSTYRALYGVGALAIWCFIMAFRASRKRRSANRVKEARL